MNFLASSILFKHASEFVNYLNDMRTPGILDYRYKAEAWWQEVLLDCDFPDFVSVWVETSYTSMKTLEIIFHSKTKNNVNSDERLDIYVCGFIDSGKTIMT